MSSPHVVPLRTYLLVFGALLVLTALTTGVAFINLGPLNTVAAMAIAFTKMLLVLFFFMHLKYSARLMRVVVLAGFFWFALLLALVFADYSTRGFPASSSPAPWSVAAPPTHP